MRRLANWLLHLLLFLYILAHALVALSLLVFGLCADGWVLHPLAVAWYGLFVVGGLLLLGRSWRHGVSPWLLVVPPILALAAVGAFPSTGALGGASYAPYDLSDVQEMFIGLNLFSALALTGLALLYRWPRLLLAWVTAQGLLLVTYPVWWAALWRWGMLGTPVSVGALALGLPLLYALAARTLGASLPRRWGRWVLAGLVVGIGLTILAGVRYAAYARGRGFFPGAMSEMWLALAIEVLLWLAFGALLMPLPLLAGRLLRAWAEEGERRFPWEALALMLWVATSIAASFMQLTPAGWLPAPGGVQGWRSPEHVVPDAWLPAITWAGWLFTAVRWPLLPYALLGLVNSLRAVRPRLELPSFPGVLLWAGMGWLAAYAWDFSPLGFPLHVAWETYSVVGALLPLPGGVLLILAGRAAGKRWGLWEDRFWRWMTVGGFLALLTWVGRAAWAYGRVLFAPLPAWTARWQYAPLPPTLLSSLGLAVHLMVLALGILALGRTLRAWTEMERPVERRSLHSLVWPMALPLLLLGAMAGLWWWATAPAVVRTVPRNGATDVPRDTVILVEMAPQKSWLGLLLGGNGQGISTRYADTGDYIQGMSGAARSSFFFDPEGLLRPNAPLEITVHRTGERPYTLRFTTAGVDGPTATPMPGFPGFPATMPTVAPPPTPPGEVAIVGYLCPAPATANYAFELDTAQGPVWLVLAEGRGRENLGWLMEHGHLTLVRGRWLSRSPPTLEVAWDRGAARGFNRSTPLAEVYTNPLHGYAIEYPAGWVVEQDGEVVRIQNFQSVDLPPGYNLINDPSLYSVNIISERKFQSLSQLRDALKAGDDVTEVERSGQVNGREAMWLTLRSPEGRRQHLVLVDWKGSILTLATWQDPALLERMVETLRSVRR